MRIRARRTRGFTLIELMIAVAIIGVLATTAIAGFRGYQLRTKRSEAMSNLASIRTAQNSYYPEANTYVEAPASPALPGSPGPHQQNWVPTGSFSSAPGLGFDTLGWQPEGAVYFDYDTLLGPNGTSYTAAAYGDTDGDGFVSVFVYMMPDGAGNVVPSWNGGFTAWNQSTCQPIVNAVAQVPSVAGCGFPTADDF